MNISCSHMNVKRMKNDHCKLLLTCEIVNKQQTVQFVQNILIGNTENKTAE